MLLSKMVKKRISDKNKFQELVDNVEDLQI
jgi:hypothetical protein